MNKRLLPVILVLAAVPALAQPRANPRPATAAPQRRPAPRVVARPTTRKEFPTGRQVQAGVQSYAKRRPWRFESSLPHSYVGVAKW